MLDLSRIDLGKDEAEQDEKLSQYFLKTKNYENALAGIKTIILGRKGSGKSAIFKLLSDELPKKGIQVVELTPDQYSWSALRDYTEQGIMAAQAHTNAWRLTFLSAVIWKLNELSFFKQGSKLVKYYQYMRDTFTPDSGQWFLHLVDKIKNALVGIKTQWVWLEETSSVATPLNIINQIQTLLISEWPPDRKVRILVDRLDDSWDASEASKNLIIGLLKASNEINSRMSGKVVITTFLRSDIYDFLFFDDQDKLRQNEEIIRWTANELREVICERVKVSLGLDESNDTIWRQLFSPRLYRSKASAEKYLVERTFKRPRDMISFVRLAIETAITNEHSQIESTDTRLSEESGYSQSKYKDLIIEYQRQMPYIKDLLDSFSGTTHALSMAEIDKHLRAFIESRALADNPQTLLRSLFQIGFVGIKRRGRAGVRQRGGTQFYYYYDDPSINPLSYSDFFIHPSLRYHLNIKERKRKTRVTPRRTKRKRAKRK